MSLTPDIIVYVRTKDRSGGALAAMRIKRKKKIKSKVLRVV